MMFILRFKLRYLSFCLVSLNPIQNPPITTIEMALTRRLGMAMVALIAFATTAFVAAPAGTTKEKRAFIRSTVKARGIGIFSNLLSVLQKNKGCLQGFKRGAFRC